VLRTLVRNASLPMALLLCLSGSAANIAAQQTPQKEQKAKDRTEPTQPLPQQPDQDEGSKKRPAIAAPPDTETEIREAFIRLPLAAVLGTALALRPKRRGTPPRQPAVIQTQIILSIVGALVMMVVGSNLARAFGVVGAAGLVRYRAKIEDPKDAGVMLSTLAIGLGTGVGLYAMAAFSAAFILVALWIIESFEPHTRNAFDLKIRMGDDTDTRRAQIEAILRRYHVEFELRSSSDVEVCYEVHVPLELQKDRVSNALLKLDPQGHAAVEWADKKTKAK
jgi:uncharacterized membrane protein YhiD involved in acid resistance